MVIVTESSKLKIQQWSKGFDAFLKRKLRLLNTSNKFCLLSSQPRWSVLRRPELTQPLMHPYGIGCWIHTPHRKRPSLPAPAAGMSA